MQIKQRFYLLLVDVISAVKFAKEADLLPFHYIAFLIEAKPTIPKFTLPFVVEF